MVFMRLSTSNHLSDWSRLMRSRHAEMAARSLAQLMYNHIVSDIQTSNKKHQDMKLNKGLQNFLYTQLQDDSEQCAKKSLAVLTELYRQTPLEEIEHRHRGRCLLVGQSDREELSLVGE